MLARRKALGTLAHIAGAPVATGMILWMIVRILVRHSDHAPLRRSALMAAS